MFISLLLLFTAEHLCAYYKSCDSFPVAMVTGVDLQDEECMVIAKCVSHSSQVSLYTAATLTCTQQPS